MIARGDGNPGNASWGSDLSHLAISSIVKFIQEMRRKSLAYTMVGPLVPGATVIGRIDRMPA
jgi:hypothetical protein